MNADGSNPVNLTNSPGTDADAAWSPDGTRIAFVSKRDGSSQIYLMNADGSPGATRLSYDLDEAQYPRWSPDGSSIIFVGVKDGKYDLYRVSANGGIAENVTNTDGELEDHPAWRPRP